MHISKFDRIPYIKKKYLTQDIELRYFFFWEKQQINIPTHFRSLTWTEQNKTPQDM